MNRVFFKIVLLICLTGATYAELPIASENDQKTDFINCDWNFKEIWDEYLESNDKEFNSQGYLYAVSGENDRCEYGVGQDKKEAFDDCTKWKEENDIIGECELYAHGDNAYYLSSRNVKQSIENKDLKLHDQECMKNSFDKFIEVFGIYVVGTPRAPIDKVKHTAGVLAQYLDNNEDGIPDDHEIANYLRSNNFIVPVWSEKDRDLFWKNAPGSYCEHNLRTAASMYFDEDQWAIGGIQKTGLWDTNLEEVWHVVSSAWYEVYPKYFGNSGSLLHDAMDKARGGHFERVPKIYPKKAWYSYNDKSCSYECQAHEYFYWILMANINALDRTLTDKCEPNDEWNICNKSELKKIDKLAYQLLNSFDFKLPTIIPDGDYKAGTILVH